MQYCHVDSQTLLSFLLASFLIELTPGPNMSYLAIQTIALGKRAGLTAVAGVALGLSVVGGLAALGVAEALDQMPVVYEMLRWGGIAYLLYLAFETWRDADAKKVTVGGRLFLRGFLNNVLSPKAALFFVTVIPAFLPVRGGLLASTLLLSVIYVVVATLVHLFIVLLANYLRNYLADPNRLRSVRRGMAALLVLVAIWVFYATKP